MKTPPPLATASDNGPVSRVLATTAQWTATAAPRTQARAKVAAIVPARTDAAPRRRAPTRSSPPTTASTPATEADHAASMKAPASATDHVTSTAGTSRRSVRFDAVAPPAGSTVPATGSATLHRHKILERLHELRTDAINGVKFLHGCKWAVLFPPVNNALRSHRPHSGQRPQFFQ